MLATPFSIVLMFTLAAADPQAQAPPQPTTQPPPATAAPSADDAAARQRAAEQKLLQDWPNLRALPRRQRQAAAAWQG